MSVLAVVQEVIEFFVMVYQFGVPQALFGVRRMLPLIWSKEPGVREAVLNAYRQLYLSPKGDSARSAGSSPSLTVFLWFFWPPKGRGILLEEFVLHGQQDCCRAMRGSQVQ